MTKKKIHMIIGKKQIILACLTLILGIAIYLNYILAQGNDLPVTDTLESEGNYGDVMLVSGGAEDANADVGADANADGEVTDAESDEYFAQARLDKMMTRDAAVETLENIFSAGDLTKDELAMAAVDAVSLTNLMESESKIENLVKAQGFEDCLVYLDGESANIIVKTPGLTPEQAAQIKDTLLGEVEVDSEFITIVEVN